MENETSRGILERINEILAAFRQKDFEEFRTTVRKGAALLAFLASNSEALAAMSYEDLKTLVEGLQQSEQEQALRLLTELRDQLPVFGTALIKCAQMLPQSRGGRQESFKDRESMREACRIVIEFIRKGCSEAEAKRRAAKRFDVSAQTIHRIWKQRAVLQTQMSLGEFFSQLLASILAASSNQLARIENPGDRAAKTLPEGQA